MNPAFRPQSYAVTNVVVLLIFTAAVIIVGILTGAVHIRTGETLPDEPNQHYIIEVGEDQYWFADEVIICSDRRIYFTDKTGSEISLDPPYSISPIKWQ